MNMRLKTYLMTAAMLFSGAKGAAAQATPDSLNLKPQKPTTHIAPPAANDSSTAIIDSKDVDSLCFEDQDTLILTALASDDCDSVAAISSNIIDSVNCETTKSTDQTMSFYYSIIPTVTTAHHKTNSQTAKSELPKSPTTSITYTLTAADMPPHDNADSLDLKPQKPKSPTSSHSNSTTTTPAVSTSDSSPRNTDDNGHPIGYSRLAIGYVHCPDNGLYAARGQGQISGMASFNGKVGQHFHASAALTTGNKHYGYSAHFNYNSPYTGPVSSNVTYNYIPFEGRVGVGVNASMPIKGNGTHGLMADFFAEATLSALPNPGNFTMNCQGSPGWRAGFEIALGKFSDKNTSTTGLMAFVAYKQEFLRHDFIEHYWGHNATYSSFPSLEWGITVAIPNRTPKLWF